MITNLDIYFSDACNGNCTYCIMKNNPQNNNTAIQQALQYGTFRHHVCANLTPDIISLGIWGMEPSVNGKYFRNFITEILDYSPYIRYIMIPTNGLSTTFYFDFIQPLIDYTRLHKRKLIVMVQFSLDGPPQINDVHRGQGTTQQVISNMLMLYNIMPKNLQYLKLRLSTKSTLQADDLAFDPTQWWAYMNLVHQICTNNDSNKLPLDDIYIGRTHPTIEVPGNYSAQNGRDLCKWLAIHGDTLNEFFSLDGRQCQAGEQSKTVDYRGNIWDCHLLVNKAINIQTIRNDFENKMNQLVASGEAIEQDREKLFKAIMSIYCWATANNDMPESYIKLLGNGALL